MIDARRPLRLPSGASGTFWTPLARPMSHAEPSPSRGLERFARCYSS